MEARTFLGHNEEEGNDISSVRRFYSTISFEKLAALNLTYKPKHFVLMNHFMFSNKFRQTDTQALGPRDYVIVYRVILMLAA